ncbi:MAG: hypothetical protein KKH04_11670 [Proteobacteria bacterium]|nr:hypothetical protein [Pseudomonadota bacterium]
MRKEASCRARNSFENIPIEELEPQKTGIDDATLLAFCEVFENDHKRGKAFN